MQIASLSEEVIQRISRTSLTHSVFTRHSRSMMRIFFFPLKIRLLNSAECFLGREKKRKHSQIRKGISYLRCRVGGARSVIRINVAGYSLHPKWHGVAHTYFVRIQDGGDITDIPSFFSLFPPPSVFFLVRGPRSLL